MKWKTNQNFTLWKEKKNEKVQLLSQRRISCSKIYVFSSVPAAFLHRRAVYIMYRLGTYIPTYHYISI